MSQTLSLPGLPPVEAEWTPALPDSYGGPKLILATVLLESDDLPDAIMPIENLRRHAIQIYSRKRPGFLHQVSVVIERSDAYARWPQQVRLWITIEGSPMMGAVLLGDVAAVMLEQVDEEWRSSRLSALRRGSGRIGQPSSTSSSGRLGHTGSGAMDRPTRSAARSESSPSSRRSIRGGLPIRISSWPPSRRLGCKPRRATHQCER
jgi:hypothetical protein